jgi:hypothetical protein
MKGIQGLIVAGVLGVAAALLNWAYLHSRSSDEERVTFVGIKAGRTVNRGEALHDDDLVPLRIPVRWVGNLKDFAVLYSEKQTVLGQPVWRTLAGECLLLAEDLRTPPQSLKLDEGESLMWIPVTGAFVPSLVMPGDMVSFKVPRAAVPTPIRSGAEKPNPDDNSSASDPVETIGKFKILALGNRLGSPEVMRAAKMPQLQENVLGIRVSDHVAGERENANRLWSLLQATNFRQVGIILHNRKSE